MRLILLVYGFMMRRYCLIGTGRASVDLQVCNHSNVICVCELAIISLLF